MTAKERYITRYDAGKGQSYTFRGWRLCVTRNGERFVRYFSDLKSGGEGKALEKAKSMRDLLLAALEREPEDVKSVFMEFRRLEANAENGK